MAVKKKILAAHWDGVVREISTGHCVPFLGARSQPRHQHDRRQQHDR